MSQTEPLPRTAIYVGQDASTGQLIERRVWIEWLNGPAAGQRVELQGPVTVGSSPEADVSVPEPSLSRLHARLSPCAQGLSVDDLGSTNGTYVAGVRLMSAVLEAEAVVVLGRLRLRVHTQDLGVDTTEQAAFGIAESGSVVMRQLFGVLARAAASEAPILLSGETGTGKSMLARAVHEASPRRSGPLVVVDCPSLTDSLADSELFGHVRGAFTGAVEDREGLFAEADGGSLLFDELGSLSLSVQVRLLRALETGRFRPVGSTRERSSRFRILSTSQEPLHALVAQHRFRADLFYRLAVVELTVPPLRERLDDLPALVHRFLVDLGHAGTSWGPEVLERLRGYLWPGNLRELRSFVERALHVDAGRAPRFDALAAGKGSRPAVEQSADRKRIMEALLRHGGNQTRAARELGISRRTLQSRLDLLNIPRPRKP